MDSKDWDGILNRMQRLDSTFIGQRRVWRVFFFLRKSCDQLLESCLGSNVEIRNTRVAYSSFVMVSLHWACLDCSCVLVAVSVRPDIHCMQHFSA